MVRGLSAVLAVFGTALAYLLIAPSLPLVDGADAPLYVAGCVGIALLAACGLALVAMWDEPFVLVTALAGCGMIGAALTSVDAPAPEDVAKAVTAAALGMLLASLVRSPTVLAGVAVLVAGIDLWSVLAGPAESIVRDEASSVDALGFALPRWGGGGVLEVSVASLVFLGFYAGSAWRFGLRRRLTGLALLAAPPAAVAVAVALDRPAPVIAAVSLAVLLPNADRLARLLRAERAHQRPEV